MRHCPRKPTHSQWVGSFIDNGETEARCYKGKSETPWPEKLPELPDLFEGATSKLCICCRLVALTRERLDGGVPNIGGFLKQFGSCLTTLCSHSRC